jgi:hypothetical protein
LLAGYTFHGQRSTGSKADRARPLAAQAEGGAVKLARGRWNKDFLDEAEVFPFGGHEDQIDAASMAFGALAATTPAFGETPCVLVPGREDPFVMPARATGALGYGAEGAAGWW